MCCVCSVYINQVACGLVWFPFIMELKTERETPIDAIVAPELLKNMKYTTH